MLESVGNVLMSVDMSFNSKVRKGMSNIWRPKNVEIDSKISASSSTLYDYSDSSSENYDNKGEKFCANHFYLDNTIIDL